MFCFGGMIEKMVLSTPKKPNDNNRRHKLPGFVGVFFTHAPNQTSNKKNTAQKKWQSRQSMVKYSIIVRAFNEEKHIGKLLDRIYRQTLKDTLEVILVDSGSKDNTRTIAAAYPTKIVHIRAEDFTFGRALNQGIAASSGQIAIFASAHVYPTENTWLEKLVAPFADPQIALSYGRQIGHPEITQYAEHQVFMKWFPQKSYHSDSNPFCNNANAAIRKSLWQDFRYDEYLTGLEDLHWANQMLEKGFKIAYIAEAPVVHIHEERPAQTKNRYRREAIAYKKIFPHASFGFFDFVWLFVSNVVSDCLHARKEKKLSTNLRSILQFRFMQFWGTYKGYQHKGKVTQMLKKRFYYPNKIP